MRKTGLVLLALGVGLIAIPLTARLAGAQISGVVANTNAGNSPDNMQDNSVGTSYQRTSTVGVLSNNGFTARVRYQEVIGVDVGWPDGGTSNALSSDYSINFNVTAPVGYELTITSSLNGALTLVDDGSESATATVGNVTGSFTGGTLVSGGLGLSSAHSLSGNGGGNTSFHHVNTATIRGSSLEIPQAHSLHFTWSGSCATGGGFFTSGGDECAVRLGIPIGYGGETAGDYPGSGGRNAADDGHFVTISYESLCGNGVVDSGEQCDLGAQNGDLSQCCTLSCTFRPSGTCRASAGPCDITESCSGTSASCPADTKQPSGVVCRQAIFECDLTEFCNGTSVSCPADSFKTAGTACSTDNNPCTLDQCDGMGPFCGHPAGNAGTQCRAANGVCDVAEFCTGTSTTCPADAKLPSGTVCRSAIGVCDQAETCTGTGNNCPVDQLKPTGTSCRAAAGVCDNEEFCTGFDPNCPIDSAAGAFVVCRPSAGPCDVAENCDGSSINCPADAKQPSGHVCRLSAGVCDVAETCDGSNVTCPADGFRPSGFVCRSAAGECDLADACTGGGPSCPADAKKSAGTACTADSNPCTLDQCDGSGNACTHPAGNAGATCRSAAGVCDVAETCDGSNTACPADAKSTAVCRSANGVCDVADSCDGVNNTCPADGVKPAGIVCRSAAGICDNPDFCDGVGTNCPADSVAGAFVVCRPSAGPCDVAETCTGSGVNCPADSVQPSGTVCRTAAGVCDVAEVCNGSSVACPADGVKPSGVLCRSSAGVCDVPEACDGSSANCPTDGFEPSSTVCRSAAGQCDADDTCTGSSAACPADGFQPDGTSCMDGDPCTTDSCQGGVCTGVHNINACLDDFQCYKVRKSRGQLWTPILNVQLEDTVENGLFDVKKVQHLCPPANRDNGGVVDSVTHLVSYVIRPSVGQPVHTKHPNILVGNALNTTAINGPLHLDTVKADLLMLPSDKNLSGPATPPNFGDHNVDRFKCYKIRVTKGTTKFPRGVQATVGDQFTNPNFPNAGPTVIYDVKSPKHLCYPVKKDTQAAVKEPNNHMLCYKVKPAIGQPLHLKRTNISIGNDFNLLSVDTSKEDELCIPSELQ